MSRLLLLSLPGKGMSRPFARFFYGYRTLVRDVRYPSCSDPEGRAQTGPEGPTTPRGVRSMSGVTLPTRLSTSVVYLRGR